jgi:hypothetical protein
MAEVERHLDLGPPQSFRDLWTQLKPPKECPVVWCIYGEGIPESHSVLGRFGDVVVCYEFVKDPANRPPEELGYVRLKNIKDCYPDRETAALHGLVKIRDKLVKMADCLIKITDAAGAQPKKT